MSGFKNVSVRLAEADLVWLTNEAERLGTTPAGALRQLVAQAQGARADDQRFVALEARLVSLISSIPSRTADLLEESA